MMRQVSDVDRVLGEAARAIHESDVTAGQARVDANGAVDACCGLVDVRDRDGGRSPGNP